MRNCAKSACDAYCIQRCLETCSSNLSCEPVCRRCVSSRRFIIRPIVIFLNGASSSGKTTLGRTIQRQIGRPFFYLSSDQFVSGGFLPDVDRVAVSGPWAWKSIRPRFFRAFHSCIHAFSEAGIDLIVEHVVEKLDWYHDCVRLLADADVFYVGVYCPLVELERREKERGDRFIGEGRSHIQDGVHTWGRYDFEIDTSTNIPETTATMVIEAFEQRSSPSAFQVELAKLPANREPS